VRDFEKLSDEALETSDWNVGDVTARYDDIVNLLVILEVLEHQLVSVAAAGMKGALFDERGARTYKIHAGAVPTILGAGRGELKHHLAWISMDESLDGPRTGLIKTVPSR
jgi:hypothetical protein